MTKGRRKPTREPVQLDMFGGMSPAAAREHLVAAVDRNGQYVDWDRDTGKLNVYVSERGADDGEVTLDGHFTKQDLVALITLWPAT